MALTANNYLHISGAGTYSIPTNANQGGLPNFCGLEDILVNTAATGTITVTEQSTGTTIAVIDTSVQKGHGFDLSSLGGVQLVVVGAADITVIWQ